MDIIEEQYLTHYKSQLQIDISQTLNEVGEIEWMPKSFNFYTSVKP